MSTENEHAPESSPRFASARSVTRSTAELYRAPRRIKPSAAADKYLRNDKGAFDLSLSPMMQEPLDHIGGREYQGIVFVGPARSSKTYSLVLGGITYVVTSAPGDMLVVQMSGEAARDFSRGDLDKSIRYSDELRTRLSGRARDDNTFDKFWRSGVSIKIAWPAVSQLSSKTLQYVWITDYDRPENRDNVDGEGPIWDLASKRVETYMSRGKCIAESSPGEEMLDPQWRPITPHEAPPVPGIMSLYNRGTRARWYWPCPHCGEFFEAKPGLELFQLPDWPKLEKIIDLVKTRDTTSLAEEFAFIVCKKCGGIARMEHRTEMNRQGVWVHEGQTIKDGKVIGERKRSTIASYWLGGVAATYQRWDGLLAKYFQSVLTYARSGDESPLKATTMTDQGMPYISPNLAKYRGPESLISRLEDWDKAVVPTGVRFLTAAIDVQAFRFVVQVHGWGVGLEEYIVDRFNISTSSARMEAENRQAAIDPASYAEDWTVLINEVINRRYPVTDVPGAAMGVKLIVCDSGGKAGVTNNAYAFWRRMRAMQLQQRFALVKGDTKLNSPRVRQTFPDTSGRKDRVVLARGDVPLWMLNVNVLKDGISNNLGREVVGPGYVHLPKWLEHSFFDELTAETKDEDGRWSSPSGARNEAFDLAVYNRAAAIILGAEKINWERPPEWAAPLKEQLGANAEKRAAVISDLARNLNG